MPVLYLPMDNETFRKLALSFQLVEELPHFEKTSFRINGKIFATLNEGQNRACVKLSENDQYIFSLDDAVFPVPNKWGLHGWTNIILEDINEKKLNEILRSSFKYITLKNKNKIRK